MEMLNTRRLVAVDIALHGSKFIIIEFGIAIVLAPALGLLLFRQLSFYSWYIIALGLNYVPLFIYALDITRNQSAKTEAGSDLSSRERLLALTRQQFIVFIPFSMILLSVYQELQKKQRKL